MNLWSWAKPHWSRDKVKDSCSCLAIVQNEPRVTDLAILGQAEEPELGRTNSYPAPTEMGCSEPGPDQHPGTFVRDLMGDCRALSLITSEELWLQICLGIDLPELTSLQQGRTTQAPQKPQREIAALRTFQPFRSLKLGQSLCPGLPCLSTTAAEASREPKKGFPSGNLLRMGWMKPVIFPESATSDHSNPLKSLPKAGT